tara:strand:- start:65343 stop:65645 length:303 start_codon:yes stop_codon:yes gene_type:complete
MNTTDQENKYFRAKERVASVKKFYAHLVTNIFVIILTGAINYYTNEWRYPWFLWVVFGVSIGTIVRAFKIFGYDSLFGKNWEQRKIDEYMKEDETKSRWE